MDRRRPHKGAFFPQLGVMSNWSTVSALIRVLDDWQRALDQGNEVCVVFSDVSKAFDTASLTIAPKIEGD